MCVTKTLIVDGVGYIGHHMVKMLFDVGYGMVTIDSLKVGDCELLVRARLLNMNLLV